MYYHSGYFIITIYIKKILTASPYPPFDSWGTFLFTKHLLSPQSHDLLAS